MALSMPVKITDGSEVQGHGADFCGVAIEHVCAFDSFSVPTRFSIGCSYGLGKFANPKAQPHGFQTASRLEQSGRLYIIVTAPTSASYF